MKKFGLALARFSVDRPRVVMWLTLVPTVVLLLAAALPSVWPRAFPWLNGVTVDTDPENMLSHDEAVRVFHDKMKREFSLHDIVVLGVVNEEHPERPADVRKMAFMVWKHLDKDDDRWLYLPALDLAKRLAASDKRTSFVGSDFFYEDVSGRGIAEDTHELVETTDEFYVVKNTPRSPDSVEFAHYTTWIDRQTFVPMKSEYVDKAGNYYRGHKVITSETIDGKPTVTKAEMVSTKTGSKTVVEYSKVKYDVGLPEDIFTERYLRRAPRQHLR